jgi:hypothetical protein
MDQGSTDGAAQNATESKASYFAITVDLRRCFPGCGGYWVTDLNSQTAAKRHHVSVLEADGIDQDTLESVKAALQSITPDPQNPLGELVVKGQLGDVDQSTHTSTLRVSKAYRGMPGVTVQDTDAFYQLRLDPAIACERTPCPNYVASALNTLAHVSFVVKANVDKVGPVYLDREWLEGLAETSDTIIAGTVGQGTLDGEKVPMLNATQVYVALPYKQPTCSPPALSCPDGKVATFTRDRDRCVRPDACVTQTVCPEFFAMSPKGYVQNEVIVASSGNPDVGGCPRYYWDPQFLEPAPTQAGNGNP